MRIINWSQYGLIDEMWNPGAVQIELGLAHLDGVEEWAYALARLGEGEDFRELDFSEWPKEYIQSAGTSGAMTVEVRRREGDVFRHYAVGRIEPEPGEQEISWASNDPGEPHRLTIPSSESFTASQALPLYLAWADGRPTPGGFRLRPLDLDAE